MHTWLIVVINLNDRWLEILHCKNLFQLHSVGHGDVFGNLRDRQDEVHRHTHTTRADVRISPLSDTQAHDHLQNQPAALMVQVNLEETQAVKEETFGYIGSSFKYFGT